MDFILDHKWEFFIAAEVIFWISILSFLILRYWFKLNKLSFLFFGIFIVNDLWIATMGFMDYMRTGEFTSYQVVILIVIVYAFTYGKSDFRKLDRFIQKKVANWRGETINIEDQVKELDGKEFAAVERKHFFMHLLIFLGVHILLALFLGLSNQFSTISSIGDFFQQWFASSNAAFPFDHSATNNLSRIWTIILVIDGLISFSYTIFPKESKKHASS
ncbi:hypothetical protein MKX67_22165 [Cytobacillus sp. FSL W7-1323]|uniref:Integral membrane protein n=2 Tax=Bacillaceae TaxID=186817 RepID=A0A248TII4_9BACI|nr:MULTISPECIES: hypothetical protein [Cytobacillus]ASV67932.1 hypothetical protein CKF48_11805 [Cytobacillus kochii]MCA1026445.1 hypothetical protein [Cytobacillus kochii]MDM5209668.1 hypothetical protein [Cytobacillus kochii]MDQ0186029.1 hypothetical protein [Cytobacillus kochii]MEA1853800.1 hypothetical protein [Cytobacillus sp. OWB-43]